MDERVIQHYEGQIDKLNIYPKARKLLLNKYASLFKHTTQPVTLAQ